MSRRARRRGDKRDRFASEGSPELAAALEAIERMEHAPITTPREADTLTTSQGERIDLRAPWSFPTSERNA